MTEIIRQKDVFLIQYKDVVIGQAACQAARLTIYISEKYRDMGFGQQALAKIIKVLFLETDLIQAEIAEDNQRACHVFQKLGFQKQALYELKKADFVDLSDEPRLYLKKLNADDWEQQYVFSQKIKSERGFINEDAGISADNYREVVIAEHLKNEKTGSGYRVPETYFYLWRDEEIIGLFKIRHYLTPMLAASAGHIGYAILPEYRGHGYATRGLAKALIKCRSLIFEDEVYLSCYQDNPASLKVMLHNGAYIHHQGEREVFTRIPL